jgi:uncharacterized cysteine cluster protein YcgN (CxxCxxCC family)
MTNKPFWKRKTLSEMTDKEWESLCDGCGQCCLHKMEDVGSGVITPTDVACSYLELKSCRCKDYANRQHKVPDCIKLTPKLITQLNWLPATCAYRLVEEKRDLFWWHPLVSGDPESVHEAGISVRGKVVSEDDVDDIEKRTVDRLNTMRKSPSCSNC